MTVGHGHGRDRSVHIVDPRLHALEDGRGGQAGGGVTLHMDGDVAGRLQSGHQFVTGVGMQQARHILDGNGVGAHILNALALLHPGIDIMHRTQGIGDGALGMLAHFPHRLQRHLDIAHVVHGIEHAKYVDPVVGGTVHELLHHVVRVVAVSQDILPAEQHLLGCIGHGFLQFANALPGILTQVADTGVEGSASPGFQGPEAYLIEFFRDGQHVVQSQARCEQGLVGVAQYDVGNTQGAFIVIHGWWTSKVVCLPRVAA